MSGKTTPVVFITANVGSIFEEPSVMLKIWTQEFLSTISRLDPKFVALHCQEVGGKNYEKSMKHVGDFVELLVNSEELRLFDKARIYLDEDYSSAENFTALGNFYFIHESITDALIFDFEERRFVDVEGKVIYSDNIENVQTKEKSKFPLEYFPECKWSRKGFLRTRWCINGTIFDLVNIHLFHDVSNFVAIESFPSVYCDTRRRALSYTLDRFQSDEFGPVPLFLFGDFNFRTDTKGVVKHLSHGLNSTSQQDEVSIIQFKQEEKIVLSLGKKEFSHSDHQEIFTSKDGVWLREFDKELEAFSDQLFEFEISFPPSYPFEEDSSGDRCYMKTRCPAWCDRVVLSHSAMPLVKNSSEPGSVEYSLMGRNTCMGDHKPVYLKFDIKGDSAKNDWSDVYKMSNCEKQERITNGFIENSNNEDKRNSQKTDVKSKVQYSEFEIEKLACSLEALMSQNSSFSREMESNIEPDLSRCVSCGVHQHGRLVNNPGGEEISKENLILEDEKIIALLASEIKVPEDLLQKIEVHDTGQKTENEACGWDFKSDEKDIERFGAVKRVNSASLVENAPKKEDWKNSRCNSDVSYSPCSSIQNSTLMKSFKGSKQFNRGSSRIRLISSSKSLNGSLPRLTSHHSSSEEEWFEEIEEGEDDVLRMNDSYTESEENSVDKGVAADSNNSVTKPASRIDIVTGEANDRPSKDSLNQNAEDKSETSPVEVDSSPTDECPIYSGRSLEETRTRTKIKKQAGKPGSSDSDMESRSASKGIKSKPLSIFKRLTEGRKDCQIQDSEGMNLVRSTNRESFETLIVDPAIVEKMEFIKPEETEAKVDAKANQFQNSSPETGDVKPTEKTKEAALMMPSTESWETIELGVKKSKEMDKNVVQKDSKLSFQTNAKKEACVTDDGTKCCCTVQ